MSSREKWLRVYDCGRNDSGEQLVGVIQGAGSHVCIVVARPEDLRDSPPEPAPAPEPEAPACTHRYTGWRTETGDEILRELFRRVDAGEELVEVLRVGRDHLADGARYVRRCVDCDQLDVYPMPRCGHSPWDREHGCYSDCHEAA